METIKLPENHFEALAQGYGDRETMALLDKGQYSLRALRLAAMWREVKASDDPAAKQFTQAMQLLQTADQARPGTIRETFLRPDFGGWIADALYAYDREKDISLFGRLGNFAAVAAFNAGAQVDFALEVPTFGQGVYLPGLGKMTAEGAVQSVRQRDGSLLVAEQLVDNPLHSDGNWQAARYLWGEFKGCRLNLLLDDLDPYRDRYGAPVAERLSYERYDQWQTLYGEAWELLARDYPVYAEALEAGMKAIIPLADAPPGMGRGATYAPAAGAAGLTLPDSATAFAVGLVHEFQHSKLAELLAISPLQRRDDKRLFYAPWRDDPRPASGLLQGAYAHAAVADFWRMRHRSLPGGPEETLAGLEFTRWRREVARTVELIREADYLNEAGEQVLAAISRHLDTWKNEKVSNEALELATLGALDHEISWRLHNVRCHEDDLTRLAKAWFAGGSAPHNLALEQMIVDDNQDFTHIGRRARRSLVSIAYREPELLQRALHDNMSELQQRLPYATRADVQLVLGNTFEAQSGYLMQIKADPKNTEPWAGLALTYRHRPERPEAKLLLHHPELAAALYATIHDGTVDPERLMSWLGTLPEPMLKRL